MKNANEKYENPGEIVRCLLQELHMASQHLELALKEKSPAEGRCYYLVWCDKHVKKAKWLADMLEWLEFNRFN